MFTINDRGHAVDPTGYDRTNWNDQDPPYRVVGGAVYSAILQVQSSRALR
jgi:hypothetical protein